MFVRRSAIKRFIAGAQLTPNELEPKMKTVQSSADRKTSEINSGSESGLVTDSLQINCQIKTMIGDLK